MEEVLKSEEERRSSFHYRLADQEQLTNSAKKRAERLEKAEAKIFCKSC